MVKPAQKIWLVTGYILALTGIVFKIYSIIPDITNYPFTIHWSEGGRIFAAYQFYVPILAQQYLSLPWLDPARSLIDGLVLLIPNLPLWGFRLWISILPLVFNGIAAFLIIRKAYHYSRIEKPKKNELIFLITLWGTLFLLQGPVYYHLLVGIFPVLLFFDERRPGRNLIIIILCSIWEGLCRINWFVMPASVGILLHVLRTPALQKGLWNYLKWPFLYLISGGISSIATYLIYLKVMGFVLPFFNPNIKYGFSLYKLLPNKGFIGLIPGILLLSLPVTIVILYTSWIYRRNLRWIRIAITVSILGIFFAGSSLVSIRVGGGYDFHNYDSFLLLVFIIVCFLGAGSVYFDQGGDMETAVLFSKGVLILLLIIPVLMAYQKPGSTAYQSDSKSEDALLEMRLVIQDLEENNPDRPPLFIDQRQLLVFQLVTPEKFHIPYEKIELMEMAMANNHDYKNQFLFDLKNYKFSLIVSEVLNPLEKGIDPFYSSDRFWYENDSWTNLVSFPVLEYYHLVYEEKEIGIAIYAPNK